MDRQSDGWIVGRTVGRSDGQTVGRSDGRSDARPAGRTAPCAPVNMTFSITLAAEYCIYSDFFAMQMNVAFATFQAAEYGIPKASSVSQGFRDLVLNKIHRLAPRFELNDHTGNTFKPEKVIFGQALPYLLVSILELLIGSSGLSGSSG